ncbi:MAG: hypothetical protein HOQ05_02690 [Corynebacteriales bacterium]|nr:hypothetical protein [Mycobacteriales bacterium]
MNARDIASFLNLSIPITDGTFTTHAVKEFADYRRELITFDSGEGDRIPAYLFRPNVDDESCPAIVLQHQHNGERHLGKSETAGLLGDEQNAFGPRLAREGFVVLCPDSICFEDRRRQTSGSEPHADDWLQHYNELVYRLVTGDTLMRKVLSDACAAVTLLDRLDHVDSTRIGTFGHSYGGNTVLFHSAIDQRIAFAASSGAACTYATKMAQETGIEMAEVIPGFASEFDIGDLVRATAPRPMLIVSATGDDTSADAPAIVDAARATYEAQNAGENLTHLRYDGAHALTQERVEAITNWICATGKQTLVQ